MTTATTSIDPMHAKDEISLVDLWIAIWRYRNAIMLVTGMITIATVAWTLTLPNQYTVVAKIQPGSAQIVAALEASDVHTKIASAFDLRQVLRQPDDRSTLRAIREMVRSSVDKRDGLLNIEVTHVDPDLAVRVANAYYPLVMELVSSRLLTQEALARKTLEIQVSKVDKALSDLEQRQSKSPHRFTEQQQFSMQITGDLRAEAALATGDAQNALQGVLRMQELIANIERLSSRPVPAASADKSPNVDSYLAQQMYQDLAFYRSLSRKLARQLEMAKEQEKMAIRLLAPAQAPLEKSKPARAQMVVMAFVFTLLVAMVLALVVDYRRRAAGSARTDS